MEKELKQAVTQIITEEMQKFCAEHREEIMKRVAARIEELKKEADEAQLF